MTKQVTIKHAIGAGGEMKVELDGTKIGRGSGEITRDVSDQKEHVLTWYVMGPPGTSYSVAITKPGKAKFSHKGVLDDAKQDVGHHWFSV